MSHKLPNKFVQMHDWANILTDPRNGAKKKLEAMQKMVLFFDADTRDHCRAALTEVLRSEKIASVRHETIKQLGIHFSWSELEWTWFLHYKRFGKADIEILSTWEWYIQNKKFSGFFDAGLLVKAMKAVVQIRDWRSLQSLIKEIGGLLAQTSEDYGNG